MFGQSVIGRYRLLAAIGHGGMADVYLAATRGPGGFNKLLVVKELRSPLAQDPDFLAMFLDEARLAARLNHPNVVQTYEVGRDGDRYFIAMEYLEGQSLHRIVSQLVERGSELLPAYLQVLADTLAGLHYAHELKDYDGTPLEVAHRDVSPHNAFLTYDGQVKLVDFGIAKARDSSAESRVGLLKGKVCYMSPEQARGERVDRRADVFAAGVVLWELVAGQRMWRAAPDVTILNRIAAGEVPKVRAIAADVPDALERIVERALATRLGDRYQTALEFQRDLERYLETLPEKLDTRALGRVVAEAFSAERERLRARIDTELRGNVDQSLPAYSASVSGPRDRFTDADSSAPSDPSRNVSAGVTPAPAPNADNPLLPSSSDDATIVQRAPRRRRLPTILLGLAALAGVALVGIAIAPRPEGKSASLASPPVAAATAQSPTAPSRCARRDKPLVELSGDIESDAALGCDKDYLLRFTSFVKPGVTLTIEPGTTLRGDTATRGTLVVQPGGRLLAPGTRDQPIVFTSNAPAGKRRPGDWGGVILLGNAPINLRGDDGQPARGKVEGITTRGEYGGSDEGDDSGVLRYVRIEYSGTEIGPGNEINGLTLAGVGRKTEIDYVQVRHTADDCFEFFGGTVDVRHLICQHGGDDGFDWDYGYSGRVQFLVLQDDPAHDNDSNGFEGDNDPNGSFNAPVSAPTIYNATLCGRNRKLERQHYGALVRRGTRGSIANVIFTGFGAGFDVRDERTDIDVRSCIFFANLEHNLAYAEREAAGGPLENDDRGFDELEFLREAGRKNSERDPKIACFDPTSPQFQPEAAIRELAEIPPDDDFFDSTANFIGAFRDREDDWAKGPWVVWSAD